MCVVCVCVCVRVCGCVWCILRYREQCLEAKQVVWVSANEVVITSKDDTVYRFAYDHCFYWSPDSSLSKLDDQERVYRGLAKPLLDRSFEGYNTCLFAYGQVGCGMSKSGD